MIIPFFTPPAKPAFLAHVRRCVLALGLAETADADAARFAVVRQPDGQVIFLENLYAEYCRTPWWRRNAVLRRFLSAFTQEENAEPLSRGDLEACLAPALRDQVYVQAATREVSRAGTKDGAYDFPVRPLAGGVYLIQPVIDRANSMRGIQTTELAALGMTVDDAIAAAVANLKLADSPFVPLAPGVWASQQRDCYDSARVLLVDRIRRLMDAGDAVAVPVHRDELLIADSGVPGALDRLAALAEAHADGGRPIGLIPLRLGRDGWEEFIPPDDDAHAGIRRLWLLGWMGPYGEQKHLLETAANAEDIHVASYTVMARKDSRRCLSFCVWIKDLPQLLPRTDVVILMTNPDQAKTAPWYRWDDLMPWCAGICSPNEMSPARWRTTGFPDAVILAGLIPVG